MDKNLITITIDNYNNKRIIYTMPSDVTINVYRETSFIDMLKENNVFNNIQIYIEGEGITMEVEHLEEN